jgi:NAD(P)-dependent dehydrogenase (short-subunit alcohol dehydrogenase family)
VVPSPASEHRLPRRQHEQPQPIDGRRGGHHRRGVGFALGKRCAERGFGVALLDRDGPRAADEVAALAAAHGIETLGIGVDVGDGAAVSAAASAVAERFGRTDLVVSNVGVQLFGAVERLTDDEWRWLLDVNVIGSARVARTFLPLLRRAPQGRLAFTTSSSVLESSSEAQPDHCSPASAT